MGIRLHNTFTQQKEDFVPIEPGKAGMYVCGVTVYDHCHIGHARSAFVFDVINRYLLARGYDVVSVKNFTDIDDKIIRRANEEGIPWQEVGEKYIASFYEDMASLNILRPTYEPRATLHIDDMIRLVETLLSNGHAYRVDGDVYFSIESFRPYGQLSRRGLDEMLAGARVEVDDRKRNPLDFALWKKSKDGEPFWATPFGEGRPGWHLECSVMSTKYLGNPFDIHGGGRDLIFPHHENERAQTEAATGKTFVNYWVHNGFVNIEKEKMSKSIGNFLLIKDFLKEFHADALRLFFLTTHYRNPVDYSKKAIEDSNAALHRLYGTLERVEGASRTTKAVPAPFGDIDVLEKAFFDAMDDDFNAALALSSMFELSKMINKMLDEADESAMAKVLSSAALLRTLASTLGLLQDTPDNFNGGEKARHLQRIGMEPSAVDAAITERAEARKKKDYAKADHIRQDLAGKGIQLLDTPQGTDWRVKNIS